MGILTWKDFFLSEKNKEYFVSLNEFLKRERLEHSVFPKTEDTFNAFKFCPLDQLKILILGQDPYFNLNQAHGFSFSVKPGVTVPPSLRNIYKEIKSDLNIEMPPSYGCLIDWAKQGVLLLNSILTVREGQASSHKNKGWEIFTDNAIKLVNGLDSPIVFMLWGTFAKSKKNLITNPNHLILESSHPSPLSAHNGFFGSKPFSKANDFLIKNNKQPVDWLIKETA
jgi:uracil-DNA glycosylase